MNSFVIISIIISFLGCAGDASDTGVKKFTIQNGTEEAESQTAQEWQKHQETSSESTHNSFLCNESVVSKHGAEQIINIATMSGLEDIYDIYDKIDRIATIFEDCGDPWGMFPTTYRHITNRIIEAIENEEIEYQEWGRKIVVDFASRYMENLQLALLGEEPSYAWNQYYYIADHPDTSRARAVVIAMVAHLTLDLPYSLVEIETTEHHKDDYFVLGELMIEITPDFIEDLRYYYNTDTEDLLNGFFLGDWVDDVYGYDTTITLSYQTIRTKSWNNRWYLEQWWGGWIAETEIYTAFWTIDGVLATLDASGAI